MSSNSRLAARAVIAFAIICVAWLTSDGRSLSAQAPTTDPKIAEALSAGEAGLKARKWEEALTAFKTGYDQSEKSSLAALWGMARAYHGLKAYKNEAAVCLDALKLVGSDQVMESNLRNQRGMALYSLAEKNTDKVLKDAESEFRAALTLPGSGAMTRFNLGTTVLRQGGRDPEGIELLNSAIEGGLKSPQLETAKRMIAEPRRARENFAPDFSLTTRDGEFLASKDLLGKTVLVDFWGTWCPPCRAATPGLVNLYKRVAGPSFVMIGVSSDAPGDKGKWTSYLDENKMIWPQHLDTTRATIRAFEVDSYPTYVLIDPEGIVRLRVEGFSPSTTMSELEGAIKKSLKAGK